MTAICLEWKRTFLFKLRNCKKVTAEDATSKVTFFSVMGSSRTVLVIDFLYGTYLDKGRDELEICF